MTTVRASMLAAILASALLPAASASAEGGSFACKRYSSAEVREQLSGGSSALQDIVQEYMRRWDAKEVRRQCENYAAGRPYEISCLNGRRDWPAILASVPQEYFGQANKSLAATSDAERKAGNGLREAAAYCRSVGAIR